METCSSGWRSSSAFTSEVLPAPDGAAMTNRRPRPRSFPAAAIVRRLLRVVAEREDFARLRLHECRRIPHDHVGDVPGVTDGEADLALRRVAGPQDHRRAVGG